MAFFDCIVGGSGKGNTLVVTCADDLAGATITCTNGTKTYTKTCPSTAPYEVTFYGLAAGTYTVSATVSGNTYTTTVVITDYEAELGGFSWRAWVDLSKNYTSSDFTDLDDLLDTELAVRELMSIHACVDYLAGIATESADVETIIGNDLAAKWINNRDYALDTLYANTIIADYMDTADKYFYGEWVITDNTTTPPTWGAKGNVPVMTSNTAPYGEASATSQYNATNAPYMAFDGSGSTTWASSSNTNQRLVYKFTNPVNVRFVEFVNRLSTPTQIIKDYKIQYSDDGSTWHDAVDETLTNQQIEVTTTNISDKGYHLYWGLLAINDYGSANISVISLQFYGRELSVSVPTMTGNTTPFGEAFASSTISNNYAYFAFDGNSSYWSPTKTQTGTINSFVGYDFGSPIKINAFNVVFYTGYGATEFKIQGSNDRNSGWVDLYHKENVTEDNINATFENNNAYRYYRFLTLGVKVNYDFAVISLQFYGLDYSEKEFEEGTTKKWLYDHGVELETLTPFTSFYGNSNGSIDKQDSGIKVVSCSPQYSGWGIGANIDLSNYDLMRMKVGDAKLPPSTTSVGLRIYSSAVASSSSFVADSIFASGSPDIPNNIGLVISSINQSEYAYASIGNNSNTSNPDWFELKEFWLE